MSGVSEHKHCIHYGGRRGFAAAAYESCTAQHTNCATCCFACGLRQPQTTKGGHEMPGCDRACSGPVPKEESHD